MTSHRPASRVQRLLPDYTDAQLEDALALTQELRDEAISDIRLIEAEMLDRRRGAAVQHPRPDFDAAPLNPPEQT